ncbi:MAG: carboxypeptidase-like regulatory domain-containing protein, partial [Ignavibacteriae bacterium]|nr:carboxypeptidase-like regulatory domain-containing protein [Ignavibacteriota bacterium]
MNSWCKIPLIFLLSINILSAQSSKVSGVISGDGNLENATIHILEIFQFFSSDKKGNYSFIISESGNYTIQFSHLGYKTETRKLLVENGKAYIL